MPKKPWASSAPEENSINERCGVVAVAQAEHEGVVARGAGGGDLDETEVTVATVAERVGLIDDFEVGGGERTLDLFDESQVWDRRPGRRREWRGNGAHLRALDGGGAAVKDEIAGFHERMVRVWWVLNFGNEKRRRPWSRISGAHGLRRWRIIFG